jgi:hypothetical protein
MVPHDEMHEWTLYWNSLTPEDQAREQEMMAVYAASCSNCGNEAATCPCPTYMKHL